LRGEVLSFQLFDVGGTFDLDALAKTAADRSPLKAPEVGKGTPAYVEFPRPVVFGGAPVRVEGAWGASQAEVRLHFFQLGVVSVRIRVPIDVPSLASLQGFDASVVELDGKRVPIRDAARMIADRERAAWEPAIRDVYTKNVIDESYTVFALFDVGESPVGFLDRHDREIAGLLAGEDGTRLHEKEVRESLRKWFSYYEDDLVVVDWDAAFILDATPSYEDVLFVFEIANLQLLEFRAYDDYLISGITKAYDELEDLFRRPFFSRSARKTAHELSLVRMEIAEFADEVDNITKFLGDWFLARVYGATQEKFHLAAWRATVDDKLGVLNGLYQLANEESDSRRNLVLEIMIVLLFVVDVALLFLL
jgi:hypothetical protein